MEAVKTLDNYILLGVMFFVIGVCYKLATLF